MDARTQVTSYPRRLRQYDQEMEAYLRQLSDYSRAIDQNRPRLGLWRRNQRRCCR
ncbi:MAG: hypothetical protein HC918_02105 [Oscillatoriales cyanobacterium SM2_1_8]|nr:hypothetical protein [Oscillatoriales cyanobacterium SM2_1_8]